MRVLMIGCVLAFATLIAAGADDKEDKAKKELEKMQGTWKFVAGERLGMKGEVGEGFEDFAIVISGNKLTIGVVKPTEATFVIDTTTDPKLIDITYTKDKSTTEAIYRVDGDTLTLCYRPGKPPAKDRPTAFKTDEKNEYEIRIYKRDKPKK